MWQHHPSELRRDEASNQLLGLVMRYFNGPRVSTRRLANFDRRPFSSEFDGIVKIFAKPTNWPQNAVPAERRPLYVLVLGTIKGILCPISNAA